MQKRTYHCMCVCSLYTLFSMKKATAQKALIHQARLGGGG